MRKVVKIFLLILFVIFLFTGVSKGQETIQLSPALLIEPGFAAGRIIKYAEGSPINDKTSGIYSLNIIQTSKGKIWHQLYNHPETGLMFLYARMGRPSVLGNAVGGILNLSFIKELTDNVKIKYFLGTGLAYLDAPYDYQTNPINEAIGSHLNNATQFKIGLEAKGKSIRHQLGLSLTHFSNGHVKIPNIGLNILALSLSSNFKIKSIKTHLDTIPGEINKKPHLMIKGGFGYAQAIKSGGPIFPVYQGSLHVIKRIRMKDEISAGVEYSINKAIYYYIKQNEVFPPEERLFQSSRTSAFAAHEYLLGHVGIYTSVGAFLYKAFGAGSVITAKLGLQYYFLNPYKHFRKQLMAGIYVNTLIGKANYVNAGIGYVF